MSCSRNCLTGFDSPNLNLCKAYQYQDKNTDAFDMALLADLILTCQSLSLVVANERPGWQIAVDIVI